MAQGVSKSTVRRNLDGLREALRAWKLYLVSFDLLLFIGISSVAVCTQNKRLVTFDDLTDFRTVQSMELSPDGTMLAYTISWDHPELELVSTLLGSVPRHLGNGEFPKWSPDGQHLAYYSRDSGTLQLWVFDIKATRTEQVTHLKGGVDPNPRTANVGMDGWSGDPLRYAWSPDSTKLVFPSQVVIDREGSQDISSVKLTTPSGDIPAIEGSTPLVLTATSPPEWTLAGIFRGGGFGAPRHYTDSKTQQVPTPTVPLATANELFIVDIRSKVIKQITQDNFQYFTPDWSPDGKKILCVSMEGRALLGWGSGPTNLYVFDIATGKRNALTADAAYKRIPSWSPDGNWIAYFGAGAENLGKVSLFVIPSVGGTAVDVSAKLDRRITESHWFSDSKSIAITYWDGVNAPIARLSVASGAFEVMSGLESAYRTAMSVSRWDTVAWSQSDASGPAFIHLLPRGEPESYSLIDLNPEVKKLQLGTQEVVRWKNGHGNDMEGILIMPVGYQEGHRYPLIVDPYPKLQNDFKGSPMMPGQAWASRGYAVFYPDGDGPHVWENPWRSSTNNTSAKGPAGVDIAVDDVVSGVDELIRRGLVDSSRMCLYGFSNGGAVVNQVITKTNRFKCAVSVGAALSADWSLPFFFRSPSKAIEHLVGVLPWENPQTYIALSALYHLDKVNTPMILADGDDDGLFLLTGIEMYNGLRYLGKDVTFLRYAHQGHGFEGAAMKNFWERENAFFDKHLKSEPQHN